MNRSRVWLTALGGFAAAGSVWAALQLPPTVNMSELDTSFIGEREGEQAGISIASVGDLNGDGISDLVIGAAMADTVSGLDAGKVYVIFGRDESEMDTWDTNVSLENADVILSGEVAKDELGSTVTGVGDVNRDGLNDFVASAHFAGGNGAGKVYLVLGRDSGWSSGGIADIATASFLGNQGEGVGYSLSGAGDVDRDGYDDFLIGSNSYTYKPDPEGTEYYSQAGRAFLVLGRSGGWSTDVILENGADASFVGNLAEQFVGKSVGGGGDLNGDGWDDIVIGAPGSVAMDENTSLHRGEVAIFFGRTSGWDLNTFFVDADVTFVGENSSDEAGGAVSVMEDLTGDGIAELVIGSPSYDANGLSKAGKVYVIKGKPGDQWTAENSLADADGSWIGEAPNDEAGSSLAQAGDLNEDGFRDIMVGSAKSDAYLLNAGKVYIIYSDETFPPDGRLVDADIQLVGFDEDSRAGRAIAGNMDIDGDGFRDLAIGAPKADYDRSTGVDGGAVYISRGALFQDTDSDGYSTYEGDCAEGDPASYPGADELPYDGTDQDCDGSDLTDVDEDTFISVVIEGGTDCDDEDPNVYPDATELCNGKDDDCDDSIDEDVKFTFYQDADGDGYGNPEESTEACELPEGYAANANDCDDTDVKTYGDAYDIPYDGMDQDCDGKDTTDVDGDGQDWEGVEGGTDCADDEPDIYLGADEIPYDDVDQDCDGSDLIDADGDGFDWEGRGGRDCDDDNPEINPDATDIPYDGIDQDCDGEDVVDADGDSIPGIGEGVLDCNDEDPTVYPGAYDIPNDEIDQNCNGQDSADVDQDTYVVDDNFDDPDFDCNDGDPTIYPGAEDIPDDGVDQDCDGIDRTDVDEDGFSASAEENPDCDDNDASIYPGAEEVPYDEIDQDCDGADWNDVDGDGFSGGEAGEDCDDQDETIYPGAEETPANDIDENCDGVYADRDGDGFDEGGEPGDCDDSNEDINPDADEIPYDHIDQDCDGADLTDVDGDGFDSDELGGQDCDDSDPYVNPAMEEVLGDGIDNNCDGLTDPEDLDEDGYSVAEGDCNDDDPGVNPGSPEIPGDDIDNDCDNRVDERVILGEQDPGGCSCNSGGAGQEGGRLGLFLLALLPIAAMRFRSRRP